MTDIGLPRSSRLRQALASGLVLALGFTVGQVAAANAAVSIVDLAFQPDAVTVDQGDVVTWKNADATGHTVTADDGSFDSGVLASGDSFGNLFEIPGTFGYHCEMHPSMKGTVTVEAVAATAVASDVTPPPGTRPPDLATPDIGAGDTSPPWTPGGGAANYGALVVAAIAAAVLVMGLVLRLRRRH